MVRPHDTLHVVTSYGSDRVVRVALDRSLFGADGAPLGEPLSACQSWKHANREERRDFDEVLRDNLVTPPMSVVVRRATAPRVAEYSIVAQDRGRR